MRDALSKTPTEPASEALTDLIGHYANVFFDGWLVMLLVGLLHASGVAIPALGYWVSLFTAYVLAGLCGTATYPVLRRVKKLFAK